VSGSFGGELGQGFCLAVIICVLLAAVMVTLLTFLAMKSCDKSERNLTNCGNIPDNTNE
jgi:Tfp pilus assembly protein PilX